MRQIKLQQGDSFAMNFIVKNNGTPHDIEPGEDLAVGLYDDYGRKYIMKYKDGQIEKSPNQAGKYRAFVSSEVTKDFIGLVEVEIVVYDKSQEIVSHADKVLEMYFDERKINDDI